MKILQNIRSSALIVMLLLTVILTSCSEKPVYTVQTTPQDALVSDEAQTPEEEQIPEPTQKHQYEEPLLLDYTIPDLPEFANDISECTDTEKQYVLPDGYLYGHIPVPVYDVTNQLSIATDPDGTVFDGCGYRDHARIRSVLEIGEAEFSFVTGFIPIQKGDTIYFNDDFFDPQFKEAHVCYTVFYNADQQVVSAVAMRTALESAFEVVETNAEDHISAMKLRDEFVPDEISFVRLTLIGSGKDKMITVNEPLVPSHYAYSWMQIEKYIPADWCQEIKKSCETMNGLELPDASSVVKFMFVSDIHVDPDPSTSYTQNLGKVCAEMMRAADIPLLATGGDSCTQSSEFMPSVFAENMQVVLSQLSPIPNQNILLTVGNHDGATGASYDEHGEEVYYRFQLNNAERSAVFFDWQRESNQNKKFDSDGTYYYMDDPTSKTRYIVLNSFWSQWEGNENGFVPDIQHSFGHTPIFGSQQLTWFAEEALDMPPEYGAVIVTHFAQDAKDFHVFKGIVDAFSNQTVYRGQYVGAQDWQSTHIAVNYENAYGEILAVFQGHRHTDAVYDDFDCVPCISITTAGAYWAVRDENAPKREKETASEFAVDAVVIDRENRKIYLTRVGAGEDREIAY